MWKMGREKRGPLALEAWCRQLTDGYPNVRVDNMTTSWRNGLAFCALIHRFRPDLIEYEKLDPSDIIGNCSLAFETAESKLGIPALLDPEDMAAHEVPDRLSVLTYVAQFYSLFKNAEKKSTMPSPSIPPRRPRDENDGVDLKTRSTDKSTTPNSEKIAAEATIKTPTLHHRDHHQSISRSPSPASTRLSSSFVSATKRRFESSIASSSEEDPSNVNITTAKKSALLLAPPPCSKCQNPVYISERTVFLKKLYHRKCFACDGCGSMLNPHTADVSADQSAFFCIAKSCQVELLKLNRSSLRRDNNSRSSLNNNTSSLNNSSLPDSPGSCSTSSPLGLPTLKITDPSLLARSSFIVANDPVPSSVLEKSSISENGHELMEGKSTSENLDTPQNKENLVPLNSKREEKEEDAITTTLNNLNEENSTSSPPPPQEEPQEQRTPTPTPSVVNNARSNWLRDQIQTVEEPQGVVVKDEDDVVKMDTSEISSCHVVGGEEENKGGTYEKGGGGDGNETSKIICSGEGDNGDDGECALQKNENVSSSSISIEFKLSEPSVEENADYNHHHSLKENENVGDSGISGISSIENNVKAEQETEHSDHETKSLEPNKETTMSSLEDATSSDVITKQSEEPKKEEEKSRDDEEGTGKDEQAEQELLPSDLQAQPTEADVDQDVSQKNPFEEEEGVDQEETTPPQAKEEPAEKSQKELDCGVTVVLTEEQEKEKNTTTTSELENVQKSAEELGQESSPDAEITSPPQSKVDGLTPTPRKKKRAPQPSPQLVQQQQARTPSTPESVRPMPSPRTRSKRYSTSTTPATPSLSHVNSSASLRQEEYPAELNPFGDEDEVEDAPQPTPKPRPKCLLNDECIDNPSEEEVKKGNEPEVNNNADKNCDGENETTESLSPTPTPRTSTPTPNPSKPYNPFEDEDNDDIGDYEDDKPAGIFARRSHDDTGSISSKTSDLSNTSGITSAGSHLQKSFNSHSGIGMNDIKSLSGSTRGRPRKNRRAPLPPGMATQQEQTLSPSSHPQEVQSGGSGNSSPTPKKIIPVSPELKVIKNQVNTKVQYRKKRRAPPPRRRVEPLPEEQIKTEMKDLEIKQKELERQGISLEGTIREQMASHTEGDETQQTTNDNGSNEQLDEMIIQLWSIVNEKNDILRRQTELEYLRRSHRLEEMQAELEFQLRILMDTPEEQKADDHARTEQLLLDELLKLVDERNEVVDWLDYYRQMDREEEIQVSQSITKFKSHHSHSISEIVSHLKLRPSKKDKDKSKKDKGSSGKTSKSGQSQNPNVAEEGGGHESSTSSTKSSSGKKKLGIFGTFRKKSGKSSKNKIGGSEEVAPAPVTPKVLGFDEDKDVDESGAVEK